MDFPVTDTHCHLDQYEVMPEIPEASTQVIAMTLKPSDFLSWTASTSFPPNVFPAVGFFPENMDILMPELPRALELIASCRFVGEIGLDYVTPDLRDRTRQASAFDAILECAADVGNRVLSIHSRRSARDVVDRFAGGFPGFPILHWFSGGMKLAEPVLDHCWFSVNTAMVKSEQGRDFIRHLPRNRILLESDGPYIEVEGRPASPRDSVRVIQFFSGEWAMPLAQTAALIESNAKQVLAGTN